jgi:hypothetical protein
LTTGDRLTGEPGGKINILDKEIYMGTTSRARRSSESRSQRHAFDEILDVFFAIHVSLKVSRFRKILAAKRKAT